METARSSDQTTWRHIPEDIILQGLMYLKWTVAAVNANHMRMYLQAHRRQFLKQTLNGPLSLSPGTKNM
jgi:hypothetical protein